MPINESAKNDLRLLYQTKVDDIAFFKQQQWRVTNYAVLSYAALIAVAGIAHSIEHSLEPFERIVAVVLVAAVALAAFCTIDSLNSSLRGTRACVKAILPHLSSAFRDCYDVKWAQLDESKRDWPFPYLFYAFIVIGAIITAWILYRRF